MSLRRHAAYNPSPAHCHIGFHMGENDGRTDCVVSATSRICPVHANDYRNTLFDQLRMPEKYPSARSPAGVHLFLFC